MSIKHLWAPWRMEFIKDPKKAGCVFCDLPKENDDKKNLILHRGEKAYVILNKYPYNNGHLMIVPYRHEKDFDSLVPDEGNELFGLAQKAYGVLRTALSPEGYNLGMNLGVSGGAGIRDHLHLHIVPRWNGDTNFMPVLADVKSVPQHLSTSYDELETGFRRLKE